MSDYRTKHERAMKRFEGKFLRRMFNAIRSDFLELSAVIKAEGIDAAIRQLDRIVINDRVAPVIQDIYKAVGLYAARKTIREINKSAREDKAGFGINEELIKEIVDYLKLFLLNKAVIPISETTKQEILDLLKKAQLEGWGVDKIALQLESTSLPLWRARMIVRTETLKASSYGQKVGRQKAKWESVKMWLTARDHRVRHSHYSVNGNQRNDNEKFAVPVMKGKLQTGVDYMDGPGDLQASAGNVINCRCTLVHEAKRDENGKLIPKRNISVIMPGQFNTNRPVVTI